MEDIEALPQSLLPAGVRARFVDGVNGLRMHVLEAGYDRPGRPLVLLLHGFPELAYSWRKTMVPLADAGFHVVAPDQRGYGRTTGWSADYDQDLRPYSMQSLVADALCLVHALGQRKVALVAGHDFGSPVAAWCALIRPDVFRAVTMMSAPFPGPPPMPNANTLPAGAFVKVATALSGLNPPRKHYILYNAGRATNDDMMNCPEGLHAFLRAYFHSKSGDWSGNNPVPLQALSVEQFATMPNYYIMNLKETMPDSVAHYNPSAREIAECRWLTDAELDVYEAEFRRTGFQGGLNWYRATIDPALNAEMILFSGRTIDVPSMFVAGKADWGTYQNPGALERLKDEICSDFRGSHLIDGAGHWVMQEKPDETNRLLLEFCRSAGSVTAL